MRNLILFAVAFSVCLTEADVEQLGYDVTEEDFKNYFGIPLETAQNSGFAKNENFKVTDLADQINEAEKEEFAKFLEVEAAGAVPADSTEAPATEAAVEAKADTPKPTKEEKAAAKKAEAEATKKAKEEAKAKEKAEKDAKKLEAKKPGVIASILDIITNAAVPVNEDNIVDALAVLFPEKTKDSMRNTVRAQVGGKTQPTRMEQEKKVTFVITSPEVKEGEKAVRFYAIKK